MVFKNCCHLLIPILFIKSRGLEVVFEIIYYTFELKFILSRSSQAYLRDN